MSTFLIISGLGILGGMAIMPYAFWLNAEKLSEAPLPRPALIAVSILQTSIFVAIATAVGLWASDAIELGTPYFSGDKSISDFIPMAGLALILGGLAGLLIVGIEKVVFMPHLPAEFIAKAQGIPFWRRLLAILYGSFTEEILTRLFALTGLVWLLTQLQGDATPSTGALWVATFLTAFLFGLLHLPTTAAMTKLTPMIIARAILLNGLGGIIFGILYWREGLAVAMVAHFSMDVMLHIVGYALLHATPAAKLTLVET